MYKNILVASALDQGFSERALRAAKALLSEDGKITVVHVMEPVNNVVQSFVTEKSKQEAYDTAKKLMAERCQASDDIEPEILYGHPGRQISKYAKKIEADCIILGSHKPGLENFFLGSTASRVVRYAKCSVHVLR